MKQKLPRQKAYVNKNQGMKIPESKEHLKLNELQRHEANATSMSKKSKQQKKDQKKHEQQFKMKQHSIEGQAMPKDSALASPILMLLGIVWMKKRLHWVGLALFLGLIFWLFSISVLPQNQIHKNLLQD